MHALFVATANSLQKSGGGVQLCSREYQRLLRSVGLDLHLLSFESGQRFFTRVLRRLEGRPYRRMVPPTLLGDLVRQVEKTSARFIFFNEIDFPSLLLPLRERFGKSVKLVHLSHGLDSTDICIAQQIERDRLGTQKHDGDMARWLGSKLQCEADYRRCLDGAICLSPLDAELERWLGVPRTIWLPQLITEPLLDHKP